MKRWFCVVIAILALIALSMLIRTWAIKENSDVNDIDGFIAKLDEHGLYAQAIQQQPGRSEYIPVSTFEMWDILKINNCEVYILCLDSSASARNEYDKQKSVTDHLFIQLDRYLMYYNGNDEDLISNLKMLAGNSTA